MVLCVAEIQYNVCNVHYDIVCAAQFGAMRVEAQQYPDIVPVTESKMGGKQMVGRKLSVFQSQVTISIQWLLFKKQGVYQHWLSSISTERKGPVSRQPAPHCKVGLSRCGLLGHSR